MSVGDRRPTSFRALSAGELGLCFQENLPLTFECEPLAIIENAGDFKTEPICDDEPDNSFPIRKNRSPRRDEFPAECQKSLDDGPISGEAEHELLTSSAFGPAEPSIPVDGATPEMPLQVLWYV